MRQESIKSIILGFIRIAHMGGEEYVAGGAIEQYGHQVTRSKASTVRRRAQELCEDGIIEKDPNSKFDRYRITPRKYEPKVPETNQLKIV